MGSHSRHIWKVSVFWPRRLGKQSMLIMVTSCIEESLCSQVLQGPFLPDSAAWTPEGRGGPRTLPTLLVQSAHVATTKHWPPGKKLNISRCPISSAEMLKCGEKEGLSFISKARSWKKHPTLAWVSGVWSGHQGLDMIKVKRKCLRSVYSIPHLIPSSITCFLKNSSLYTSSTERQHSIKDRHGV